MARIFKSQADYFWEVARQMHDFTVKDSGERKQFPTGMVRDVTTGKLRWDLVADGPLLERWARQLTLGAEKYQPRNWMKAATPEERDRFRESAYRHFMQWYRGEADEDHAAAAVFNINGALYVEQRMKETQSGQHTEEARANVGGDHAGAGGSEGERPGIYLD